MSTTKPIYVEQVRRGALDSTSAVGITYQIITTVIENPLYTGDSADKNHLLNLFVHTIVDSSNASLDTFDHYATLADLDLIHVSREQAVLAGSTQYRDNVNTLNFDNLSVAVTASKVVRDTINNVVDTYLSVKNNFMGSSTHYFPHDIELQTLKNQYVANYTSARDARLAAETEQASSQNTYTNAQLTSVIKKDCRDVVKSLSDLLNGMNTLVHTVAAKYKDTLLSIVAEYETTDSSPTLAELKTYLTKSDTLPFDDSFSTVVITSGEITGLTLLAQIIIAYSTSNNSLTTLNGEVGSAVLAEDSAYSDLKNKQQMKTTAAELETEALATLSTYCPDTNPASL
jgi:hypothetical protein